MSRVIADFLAQVYPHPPPESHGTEHVRRRKNLERRLAIGRRWYQLMESFGAGILVLAPAEFPDSWWYRGVGAALGEVFVRHLRSARPMLVDMCDRAAPYHDYLIGGSKELLRHRSFDSFRAALLGEPNGAAPSGSFASVVEMPSPRSADLEASVLLSFSQESNP